MVPYVNILTVIARKMSQWNLRYELIPLGVKYDLVSLSKMGYHKVNVEWVKKTHTTKATQEQGIGPSTPMTAAPSSPSLGDVMIVLKQLQM